MKRFFPILAAVILSAPGFAGAFSVQMDNPILRPGASLLEFRVDRLETPVAAVVRDQAGHEVGQLQKVSDQALVWDGRDAAGRTVKPGTYYVEIESGSHLWSAAVAVDR